MPPAAPLPAPAPPATARTAFQFVGGNGATLLEANWSVAHDSPLVESLVFLPWTVHAAPNRAVVGRSAVVAAILMATRPPAEDQRDALRAMSFLTHEMDLVSGSDIMHEFDKVGAFSQPYPTTDDWLAAIPGLWAKMADADLLRIRSAWFYETHTYRGRAAAPPAELAFLHSTNLAQLALAGSDVTDASTFAFARATLLAASKATEEERTNEESTLRQVAERVRALLLHANAPSCGERSRTGAEATI